MEDVVGIANEDGVSESSFVADTATELASDNGSNSSSSESEDVPLRTEQAHGDGARPADAAAASQSAHGEGARVYRVHRQPRWTMYTFAL